MGTSVRQVFTPPVAILRRNMILFTGRCTPSLKVVSPVEIRQLLVLVDIHGNACESPLQPLAQRRLI